MSTDVPARAGRRLQVSLRAVLVASLVFALLLAGWTLHLRTQVVDRQRSIATRATLLMPITLRVEYKRTGPRSKGAAQSGSTGSLVRETARYVFKNDSRMRVKIAFPPIAYLRATESCLAYDYYPDDVPRMPNFCQQPRVVTFLPGEEKVFVARGAWIQFDSTAGNFQEGFIFGNPLDVDDPVLPCAVFGNVEGVGAGKRKGRH